MYQRTRLRSGRSAKHPLLPIKLRPVFEHARSSSIRAAKHPPMPTELRPVLRACAFERRPIRRTSTAANLIKKVRTQQWTKPRHVRRRIWVLGSFLPFWGLYYGPRFLKTPTSMNCANRREDTATNRREQHDNQVRRKKPVILKPEAQN